MEKIAVCGKGGSGKSSVVALLANGLRRRGRRVLVVDSDESNPGLHRSLGFPARPGPLLELVGGKKNVFPTFSEGAEPSKNVLTQEEIAVSDIPREYVAESDGVTLVCIGKILESLEGCACPMGALSREFLKRLSLREDEVAVVDMEARVEHFGRGVETSIDSVLIVVEPSFDSLELAEKIHVLAAQIEMANTWALLNKVASDEMARQLGEELHRRDVAVVGTIAYDAEIFQAGLEGRPAHSSEADRSIDQALDQLLQGGRPCV